MKRMLKSGAREILMGTLSLLGITSVLLDAFANLVAEGIVRLK